HQDPGGECDRQATGRILAMDPLDFVVAIPARHDATRLPGKPLRLLGGEPLVLHVARRALAAGAREVRVAADDERIAHALEGCGRAAASRRWCTGPGARTRPGRARCGWPLTTGASRTRSRAAAYRW